MSDLVAFLRARLDEDEAAANEAGTRPVGGSWGGVVDGTRLTAVSAHIARHDPARVLREVAAKRAILAEHAPSYPTTYPKPSGQATCGVCHAGGWDWDPEQWPCATASALAAVWSDHPDYPLEREKGGPEGPPVTPG